LTKEVDGTIGRWERIIGLGVLGLTAEKLVASSTGTSLKGGEVGCITLNM
jgi:hypothetical protein